MDSTEVNYTNWERASTRLGIGPEGWFLVLDDTGERRLLAERDVDGIVRARSGLVADVEGPKR